MGMGRRRRESQQELWVATEDLPEIPRHIFYERLNALLGEHGFDDFVEGLCRPFYAEGRGRDSIPPGVYFRMLLIGYFEGLGSQRGIAWRCADSLSLKRFLGYDLAESTPDHSSLTRIRDRLPLEVHCQVFQFVLGIAGEKQLIDGRTVAVDSTTLEADAAMKSIVRKDSGEDWKEYLRRLMREEGLIGEDDEPPEDELRRFDRGRKGKKVSNDEWKSPTDKDSRITKLKDGRTHLAYKAEHVVDLKTDVILTAEVYTADESDTRTLLPSIDEAQQQLEDLGIEQAIEEVVADKGYHSAAVLAECRDAGLRSYIPEPKRKGQRRWTDKPAEQRQAVDENRRRVRRAKGRQYQRWRSERVERSFAHVCDSGGARRTWLRGLDKVFKRYQLAAAARNLGLVMRKLFGTGTPRAAWPASRQLSQAISVWREFQSLLNRWSSYRIAGSTVRSLPPQRYGFAV